MFLKKPLIGYNKKAKISKDVTYTDILLGFLLVMVLTTSLSIFYDSNSQHRSKIKIENIDKICLDGLMVYSTKEGVLYQRTIDDRLVECK